MKLGDTMFSSGIDKKKILTWELSVKCKMQKGIKQMECYPKNHTTSTNYRNSQRMNPKIS